MAKQWSTKFRGLNGGDYGLYERATDYSWYCFDGNEHSYGPCFPTATEAAKALLELRGRDIQWQDGCDLIERCKDYDLHKRIAATTT